MPVPVCIATKQAPARIIVRASWPGACTPHHIHYPLLIAVCPYSPPFQLPHSHPHVMTSPPPWVKVAGCNRRPYLLTAA